MRHPRITYKDAFHHVMNRGINGEKIFKSSKDKKYFLELVLERIGDGRCFLDFFKNFITQMEIKGTNAHILFTFKISVNS